MNNKDLLSQQLFLPEAQANRFLDEAMRLGAKFHERQDHDDWHSRALKNANRALRLQGKIPPKNLLEMILFGLERKWNEWRGTIPPEPY